MNFSNNLPQSITDRTDYSGTGSLAVSSVLENLREKHLSILEKYQEKLQNELKSRKEAKRSEF
ncbi:hypothetical protein [Rubrolithibacter danxiaensis]|uniref:hypothetical protein n=1 Tax=Rubrolithibacter danxiaensis TaxID=3390805 RepID=UPI003BF7AF58